MVKTNATILWFTGLSGSGKSTLAKELYNYINDKKCKIIDGDIIRSNPDHKVDFSYNGIINNHRYIREICLSESKSNDYLLITVIAPFKKLREETKLLFGENYVEIFVKCSLDNVIRRDVKGLYKKALNNEMKNMIGVDPNVPYETPTNPDIIIETENFTIEESFRKLINELNRIKVYNR
tara:strand:+ start:1153 stop:1692 length:540 start_codon:yes stop_codon:yes gene_type:complete